MHRGEDNASSSEDGKEQKNFNLSNKSHDQLKLRDRWTSNNFCFNADPL